MKVLFSNLINLCLNLVLRKLGPSLKRKSECCPCATKGDKKRWKIAKPFLCYLLEDLWAINIFLLIEQLTFSCCQGHSFPTNLNKNVAEITGLAFQLKMNFNLETTSKHQKLFLAEKPSNRIALTYTLKNILEFF